MPKFRPIMITSIAVTLLAVTMWSIAVAWAVMADSVPLAGTGAAVLTVIAALCWLELRRAKKDRDKTILIRTLADAGRQGPRELPRTLPLPIPFPLRRVH